MRDLKGFVELSFGAVSMPRRRIGKEVFRIGAEAGRRSGLEELSALVEWSLIERLLDLIHCAAKGEQGSADRGVARLVRHEAFRGFGGSNVVPAVLRIFHDRGDARKWFRLWEK